MNKESEASIVEDFWRNSYAKAFSDKKPELYADQFALPCMIKAENMPRKVFTRREELLDYIHQMLDRANDTGWERSVIDRFEVRLLDTDVAKVSVDASRYDANEKYISRLYADYTLNKVDGAWRMVGIFGGFHLV